MNGFAEVFITFIVEFWCYAVEAAPWLLLGFLFAGLLRVLVSPSSLSRYLGGWGLKTIVTATLIGIPMPLCSCGVIPVGISLYRMGASKASSLAFFISTPATTVTTIILIWGMIGWKFALADVVASFVIALLTGFLASLLFRKESLKSLSDGASCCEVEHRPSSFKEKMNIALRYGFIEMVDDIGLYVVIGLLAAAIVAVAIPSIAIETYMGSGLIPIFIMTTIGLPIYVCSTGSVPFVAALIAKGLCPAAGLAFLIAGPATNLSTMLAVGKVMGKKTLLLYVLSVIIFSVLVAYIFELSGWL